MAQFILDANEPLPDLADKLAVLGGDAAINSILISISRAVLNHDLHSAFVYLMALALAQNYQMSERVACR